MSNTSTAIRSDFHSTYDYLRAETGKAPAAWRVACEMAAYDLRCDELAGAGVPGASAIAELIAGADGSKIERMVLEGFARRHRVTELEHEDGPLQLEAEEWQCVTLAAELRQIARDMAAVDEGFLLRTVQKGEPYGAHLNMLVKTALRLLSTQPETGVERPVTVREGATPHERLLAPGSVGIADLLRLRAQLADEAYEGTIGTSWAGYDHGTAEADVLRDMDRYCTATYGCPLASLTANDAVLASLLSVEKNVDALVDAGWVVSMECLLPDTCTVRAHKVVNGRVAMRVVPLDLASPAPATALAAAFAADFQSELPRYPKLEADWSMLTMMELQVVVDELNAAVALLA